LAAKINEAKLGVTATVSAGTLTITNSEGRAGEPIIIGVNSNVGITPKTYFNNASLRVGIPSTSSVSDLTKLGLKTGFVMTSPLAEDLLVFGVSGTGEASSVYLSGSYQPGTPPDELRSDKREYSIVFDSGNYILKDVLTNTEISKGAFDLESRSVSYGNWRALFEGIPTSGDQYTIKPNTDPMGDNRIAAAISRLQQDRELLPTGQTLQAYYEDIVNSVGSRLVQTEISKDAFEVTYRHAKERRDRVSGVNLDEELAELLRYQQAYQANAQVVQVASRLFDSLMQRL
jgi:flagellar hook-associated protein FlgK